MVMISVIIPTFNRYVSLLKAINSVKGQTFKDFEIIVINDGSTEKEYMDHPTDIIWIDLISSSRIKYGYPCPGYVRNIGLSHAKGAFIAFLDDDDYWNPNKLEIQLKLMKDHNVSMCCSDANTIKGLYNGRVANHHILKATGLKHIPDIFTKEYILKNNSIIFSSVLVDRKIIDKIGGFLEIDKNGKGTNRKDKIFEDYEFTKACLDHTDCWYHNEPLLYYDL